MNNRFQVIPRRYWRNLDGRRASLYGAVPYVNSADAEGWILESDGFTVQDDKTGTVGFYGLKQPASRADAEAFAERLTARHA